MELCGKTILVTGAAGFIGGNLIKLLLQKVKGVQLVGIDSMDAYYDVRIKDYRLKEIERRAAESGNGWTFVRGSIGDAEVVNELFAAHEPDVVVNLAAQAGVRYSIENPRAYVETNLVGFFNILEACRHSYDGGKKGVEHFVYASSSSVYGGNKDVPYSTEDKVDCPVSLYAATKKSDELMAHAYAKLYDIPCTGLRFFTVYGPAGRPDMAYFGFTEKMRSGEEVQLYNYGNCRRDFTYIDDIVEGVRRVMEAPPKREQGEDGLPIAPYALYNIGNNKAETLLDFVQILEEELVRAGVLEEGQEVRKKLVPMQAGDVVETFADVRPLVERFGFKPNTPLREGLRRFAEWYRAFYMSEGK